MRPNCSLVPFHLVLCTLLVFLPRTGGAASPLEDAVRDVEAAIVDGKSFEAAEACRELISRFTALASEERAFWIPEARLAIHRLGDLSTLTGEAARERDVLEPLTRLEVAGEPAAGAYHVLTALARNRLGHAVLDATGSREEGDAVWKPLLFLEGWLVVGPFDNERGSRFLTPLEPEKEFSLEASYEGKKRPVRWRELPGRPLAGHVDLTELFEPDEEALAYAYTHIHAEEACEAALRVASDESFRAWVNGALVATRDVHRSFGFDQDNACVHLAKGWNSILLKVTQSTGSWDFAARLSGADGSILEGVREGRPGEGESAPRLEETVPVISCEADPERWLRKRVEKDPADARGRFVLGALLLARRAHDATEHPDTEAITQAIQLDPSPAIYYLNLARTHVREATIAAQKDDNAWRQALEKASERGSAVADLFLARHYKETFESLGRATALLERALGRNPGLDDAIELRGIIEESLRFPQAARRTEDALRALPRKSLETKVDLAERAVEKGRLDEAEETLKEVLGQAATPDGAGDSARASLIDILLSRGRANEAVVLVRASLSLAPPRVWFYKKLAEIEEGRENLEAALSSLDAAISVEPEDASLHEARGKLLLRLDRKDDALSAMDQALVFQPNLPALREHVEYLRAARSTFEDAFRRDVTDVIKGALSETARSEGGEPARILLDLTAIHVNRDGTTKTFSQNVIKVLNDRGIEMFDNYGTYYAAGEQVLEFKKAKVWKPDGTAAEAKLSRHGGGSGSGGYRSGSVSLPPLSVGDVIEVEYVREDLQQSFFGDYFGHREVFQETLPVAEKALVLRVPAERKFHFHQRNMDLQATESRDEAAGTVTYAWVKKDLPKLDREPSMPDASEVGPVIEISTFETWDAFNDWYWNLIRKQFEVSPEISKKVRELTSGADSEIARIRAIYNFIVTDIRYNAWEFGVHGFKPYNAATIFARKFGDCKDKATLMVVMLKEAGIKAHPVLINAENLRGDEDLSLPSVSHFNHCITYVPPSGDRGEMYLDGTAQFHSLEELPTMDRGAKVLVVKEDKGSVEVIPWNDPAMLSITEESVATIRPDLGANVQVRASVTGDYSVFVRNSFEIAAKRKTDLERIYGRQFASSSVESAEFSNLTSLDEAVSFAVTLSVPRFVLDAPEGLTLRAPEDFFGTGEGLSGIGSLEKRVYDVLLGAPRRSSLRTVYVLPPGLRVKSMPQPFDITSRFGRLQLSYREENPGKLVATRVIELTASRVPLADYAEFREFAASMNRLEDERIVLERS